MTTTSLSCAVIGAGAAGSSAALHLARAGARVRLFEQFEFGHVRGSSHGPTRLLRIAYFEHPDYTPLMRRCVMMWRALESEAKTQLFAQTGVLQAGPPEGFLVSGVRRAAAVHDISLRSLTARDFESEFPWFRLKKGDEAIIESDAGYVLADKTLGAQARLAQSYGARLHAGEKALSWRGSAKGIHIKTQADDYVADRLVVAPGVWAPELLGPDVAPVAIKEMSLFWAGANDLRLTAARGFLPFAIETIEGRMFYGFPAIDGDGVKLGDHLAGREITSPDARSGSPSEGDRSALIDFLRDYAPGVPTKIARQSTCLYELSPDEHFMIGRHPADARVSFAAGLSGHGFKFAPVIGEALAALAFDGELPADMRFLDAARLRNRA
ncbi:MAG: N-methyl-L-tryptophan oxidase [Parvularculaceae bacterium]